LRMDMQIVVWEQIWVGKNALRPLPAVRTR
jgi:hypothetical protein